MFCPRKARGLAKQNGILAKSKAACPQPLSGVPADAPAADAKKKADNIKRRAHLTYILFFVVSIIIDTGPPKCDRHFGQFTLCTFFRDERLCSIMHNGAILVECPGGATLESCISAINAKLYCDTPQRSRRLLPFTLPSPLLAGKTTLTLKKGYEL